MTKSLRLYCVGLSLIFLLGSGNEAFSGQIIGLQPGGSGSTDILDIRTGPFSVSTIGAAGGEERLSGLDFRPGTFDLFASSGFGGTNPGSLFSVDFNTGAATFIGSTGFEAVPGLVFDFDMDGTLFGSASDDLGFFAHHLITIDPFTGLGTEVGTYDIDGDEGIDALAVDPTTGILYGSGVDPGFDNLVTINKLTGAATLLGPLTEVGTGEFLPNPLVGLTFDASGNLFGSLGFRDGRIIGIDIAKLEFTFLGDAADGSVSDIASVVPEPSTMLLLGSGLAGLGWYRRRRKAA